MVDRGVEMSWESRTVLTAEAQLLVPYPNMRGRTFADGAGTELSHSLGHCCIFIRTSISHVDDSFQRSHPRVIELAIYMCGA